MRRPAARPVARGGTSAAGLPAAGLPAAVLVVLLVLGACGPGRAPEPGRLARVADLSGAQYVVAGGETNELKILCQLMIAAMQEAGARAEEQCGKIGSVDVRVSPESSEVNAGWAYVSRADRNLDDAPDPPRSFAALAAADRAEGVTWLAPTAFADTDAVVVAGGVAASGVRTLSDLAARAVAAPGSVTLCAPPGAARDPRRVGAVLSVYGFPPRTPVRTLDAGAVFSEVVPGGGCTASVVPGTSGRIPALGLVALADDRGALGRGVGGRPGPGRGGAAPVLRSDVVARHPQIREVLREVTSRLSDDTMRQLNRAVSQAGRPPRDVARGWLEAQGLTAGR